MFNELGGAFWNVEVTNVRNNLFNTGCDMHYLLSGRTALDFIISDIKSRIAFKTVYMPSYCCHTMIGPFLDNNIEIKFYDVVPAEKGGYGYDTDFNIECDAVLIMEYFGFQCEAVHSIARTFKKMGKIVIQDSTHSIFSNRPYGQYSDYVYASLRKWTGLSAGAVALKSNGQFYVPKPAFTKEAYISLRNQSFALKKQYIEEGIGNKSEYMDLQKQAEELLDNDYKGYTINSSLLKLIDYLDVDMIKSRRQSNARLLIDGIRSMKLIECFVGNVTDQECPLYVPICVSNCRRDDLKMYLIDRLIYCPTHWIYTNKHASGEKAEYLYKNSLSLICDQRYGSCEMSRIIKAIDGFSHT